MFTLLTAVFFTYFVTLSGFFLLIHTLYLDQGAFHIIVNQVDALAFFTVHQTLLGDVEGVSGVSQSLLQSTAVLLRTYKVSMTIL